MVWRRPFGVGMERAGGPLGGQRVVDLPLTYESARPDPRRTDPYLLPELWLVTVPDRDREPHCPVGVFAVSPSPHGCTTVVVGKRSAAAGVSASARGAGPLVCDRW